jgi:bidirectional [NiFe] hydrogenase diaphorase subunit
MPDARPAVRPATAGATEPFAALEPVLRQHRERPDSLIEVLHRAQELYGHLGGPLLRHVAARLDLPLSRVYGTASFYHLFRFDPPARHSCVVCTGTACEVRGAAALVKALEAELGLALGEHRADGSLSLGAVRCLGTCSAAPVVVIDGVVGRHQSVASLLAWVRELEP